MRHLPKPPPVRRFGHAPPPRRAGTLERVRRLSDKHEEEERPFDPERRGNWRGSSRDLVLNPRTGDVAYDAQGNRVVVPDVKITVERTGYEIVPLRGYSGSVAVRDVNGRLIGWMPIEVTGYPTVKEWMDGEQFVANSRSRLTKEDEAALREYARSAWSNKGEEQEGELVLEDGSPISSLGEFQDELVRIANEDDVDDALKKFNEFFDGFGVEALGPVDMRDGPPYLYVNQGDTYNETIVYSRDDDRFMVTSWGDVWENEGQENVLQEAWDGHIASDFSRQVLEWFEHEEVDDETGRSRQGLTESQLDKITTFAEEMLEEGGLSFFQKALWEAQQAGASGSKYPEIDFGQSEVYVHHMDTVVDQAVEMILSTWKNETGQAEFKFNRRLRRSR